MAPYGDVCYNCTHWYVDVQECHKYPPQIFLVIFSFQWFRRLFNLEVCQVITLFPETDEHDECSKFESKERSTDV